MENFVLNGNGQIDINRKGMESTYKFHLQEINHNTELCSNACDDTATSVSSYSTNKQRIDAMFDDSRSILSDRSRTDRKRKLLNGHKEAQMEACKERIIANNVQEKIEKMFEEINNLQKHPPSVCQQDQKSSTNSSTESKLKQDFKVTYLGSKPLYDKSVSLTSLQDPLKELYFEYKKHSTEKQINYLTISKEGLKIKIKEKEDLNPFSTIAVWASVRLAIRKQLSGSEYAFLPLITDPDGVDKNLLFKHLKDEEMKIVIPHSQQNEDVQSPIFAVVMKNSHKQLECHAFICQSSEEAIVIAANLYQALMKKLKRRKTQKEVKMNDTVVEVPETEENRVKPKVKVKKPAPPIPVRPPTNPDGEKKPELLESTPEKKEPIRKISQRRGSVPVNLHATCDQNRTLRRTVSDRGGNAIVLKDQPVDGGDILTKVAIPRSRSFLNANGPLSRFSGRHKTNPKNEVVSPLGFKELFNEFRLHEGLESMDDILNAIIDAEGMSFNDLKPIYKEFLLKLAVTLTKDELYQRSKVIMRRQKKRNKNCNFRKRAFLSSIGLNKIFRKTASRLAKTKTSKPTNLEFTSVVFQSTTKQFESNIPNLNKNKVKRRPSSRRKLAKRSGRIKNISTSEDSDFFQPKRNTNDSGGCPNRSSSGYFSCSECSCESENCTCMRTDKCYCTLGHKKSYLSSSDESRHLHQKKPSFRKAPQSGTDNETSNSLQSCSCDTDSCVDSGKCYCSPKTNKRQHKVYHLSEVKGICQTPHLHHKEKQHSVNCPIYIKTGYSKHKETIFDQLKQQGFAASESTLSRAASPTTAWQTNEKCTRDKGCLRKTESLEYLQEQSKGYHSLHGHFLKEIQNTQRPNRKMYPEDARNSCSRKRDLSSGPSFPCGRRQYSSMRCRNELINDYPHPETLRRSVSYRTKNLFNSVRSKHSCDSIMNHIKFPSCADSSLRFPRRMDVYNSFSKGREFDRHQDCLRHSNYKENQRVVNSDALIEESEGFNFNGNIQRLKYDMLSTHKSIRPDTLSKISRKKVLVVSARDPKGKVLYMGTSNRCDVAAKSSRDYVENSAKNASEALAVKKSAEIAALFSDVTSKHKGIHLDYIKDPKQNLYRARSNSYRSTNLENTLGYLP